MKREILCGNEVSESHWESKNSSSGSCKSFIDVDGTHKNKPHSRSYCGNRFYCNFQYQKHSQVLMLFMLLVACLHLPLFVNATENNTNETTISAPGPSIPFEQISNQEVSNEIAINLEEHQKPESADNIIESSLSETLEDTIRNAVKNQIEMESSPGSPSLINVLNAMPETEKLVYVEYSKVATSTLAPSTTVKVETKETSEDILDTAVETSCDDSSLICKKIVKQDLTSTTVTPNHITSSTAAEPEKTTTAEPIIEIEAISTIDPIEMESTINPMNNIPQEEEFEVIEDNMREARNFETKEGLNETATELEPIIKSEPELNLLKETEKNDATPLKDALKSIVPVNHAVQDVKGDSKPEKPTNSSILKTEQIISSTENDNTIKNDDLSTVNSVEEINSVSENLTDDNQKGETSISDSLIPPASETVKSESDLSQQMDFKGETNADLDIEKHQNKILSDNQQNNANELPVSVNELNDLISEPLITQLNLSNLNKVESSSEADIPTTSKQTPALPQNLENKIESSTRAEVEHIFLTPKPESEQVTSEISNNLITPVSTVADQNIITPVVADHTDLFTDESPKVLNELPLTETNSQTETEIESENDPLSIVLQEQLSAVEPNILFENPQVKELVENETPNPIAEVTTKQPEFPIHNVIKKQGVEPIIEDIPILTTPTPTISLPSTTIYISPEILDYPTDTTAASSDIEQSESEDKNTNKKNNENSDFDVINPENDITTIRSMENSVANDITEVTVVFPGKGDEDAISSGKGSRSINSLHNGATEHNHKASIHVDAYPAGQTFNENLAEEMPNGIGKALLTHHEYDKSSNRSTLVIALSSCVTLLFIVVSVAIFMVSFHRQHGTLDIEMQEQRCGKDNIDEENETHIKLLEIELPNTSLALQTDAEAEIEECL